MAHTNLSHRRTHNILLISRLLNQREGASPFTLVNDSLEQPAKPLLREYIRRAKLSKSRVVFLSFETPRQPNGVDHFVPGWSQKPAQIVQAVRAIISAANQRCLLLIDSLTALCMQSVQPAPNLDLTTFLMTLLQPPSPQSSVSLVAVYHQDLVYPPTKTNGPDPQRLLNFLATTTITVHSLAVLLAEKQARERSLGEPSFGLGEQKEGVLVGLKSQTRVLPKSDAGMVLQLEHRRKSGRGVLEWYFLPFAANTSSSSRETVFLLDDHPSFRRTEETPVDADHGVTFDLKLTERQRLERDGVVLPYFDAQKAGGGEGGRILYDMGAEDDFDEEEDEI